MPNNNTILTVKNLSKSFLKKNEKNSGFFHQLQKICSQPKENEIIWALNDVSFELEKGEILGIIGKNGAGKSTLLKVLSEITAPTSGIIEYEGQLTSIIDIGTGFHPDLSGRENVSLVSSLLNVSKKEIKERYHDIVTFSGLEDYMEMPVKQYSSGMYLRLAFSIAFHTDIDILLLDEVLAVGDVDFRRKCNIKIKELSSRGTAIILVSHNLEPLIEYATRCILLENGKIEGTGIPLDIIEKYLEKTASKPDSKVGEKPVTVIDIKPITYLFDFNNLKTTLIKIDHIELNSDNKDSEAPIYNKNEIAINLSFHKLLSKDSIEINWYLMNMNNQRVFMDSYVLRPDYITNDLPIGKYRTKCIIPKNLLSRGIYTLGLVISKNTVMVIEEIPNVVRFKISLDPDNKFEKEISTLISPQLEWEFEKHLD
ncbi:MAG: ABC transporter ATP-binding protein [Flavobacteriales bacterium]|nr:ABC transporter ATP-binding protein [Flavobacteriales bacterium]